jgi:hypothetical protein
MTLGFMDVFVKKVADEQEGNKARSLDGASLVWREPVPEYPRAPAIVYRYGNSTIVLTDKMKFFSRKSSLYRHSLSALTDSPTRLDQKKLQRFMRNRGYVLEEKLT